MKRVLFLFVASLLAMAGTANALPVNGGFETGDFTGWQTLGDASIQTSAFGSGPTEGLYQAVLTNDILAFTSGQSSSVFGTVYPLSGSPAVGGSIDPFWGLPSGNLRAITRDPDGAPFPQFHPGIGPASAITQIFFGVAGSQLSFNWNYVTNDSYKTDYSFVSLLSSNSSLLEKLAGNDPSAGIPPVVPSNTIFTSETGFKTFSFILPETGAYTLGFGVTQVRDSIYDSGLIIDNVRVVQVPEPSTLVLLGIGLALLEVWRRKYKPTH